VTQVPLALMVRKVLLVPLESKDPLVLTVLLAPQARKVIRETPAPLALMERRVLLVLLVLTVRPARKALLDLKVPLAMLRRRYLLA
jgi:hypothetical protein